MEGFAFDKKIPVPAEMTAKLNMVHTGSTVLCGVENIVFIVVYTDDCQYSKGLEFLDFYAEYFCNLFIMGQIFFHT